jgi:putative transposase
MVKPFWSEEASKLTNRIWLPTLESSTQPPNAIPGVFRNIHSKSWFTVKQLTPSQSLVGHSKQKRFRSVNQVTSESKPNEPTRVRKIRLHPNPEVTSKLKSWFGSVRLTYNWALGCIKRKPKKYTLSVDWLRKRFVNKINIPNKYNFLLDTPKHVRDGAIFDLVQAYTSNFAKRRKNPLHTFDIKFRRKKDNQAITIPKTSIKLIQEDDQDKAVKMYPTFLKNQIKFYTRLYQNSNNTRKKDKENIFSKGMVNHDCKLVLDKLGRFYLMVPQSVKACENQTGCKHEWGSLDPGVRTFQTLYSPSFGVAYKFADGDISRIFRLCKHLDGMISKRKRKSAAYRKSMKKLRQKIRYLVDEVHWKVIRFLIDNFKNIIIPPFETSQMVKKLNRKIRSKTVRSMMCWSHYRFRKRLEKKAQHEGVNIFVNGEEYTTKTCTHCLVINPKVKGEKVLKCPHCGLLIDRDLGGARNIFIKNVKIAKKIIRL